MAVTAKASHEELGPMPDRAGGHAAHRPEEGRRVRAVQHGQPRRSPRRRSTVRYLRLQRRGGTVGAPAVNYEHASDTPPHAGPPAPAGRDASRVACTARSDIRRQTVRRGRNAQTGAEPEGGSLAYASNVISAKQYS